jgi:hypothetical protein
MTSDPAVSRSAFDVYRNTWRKALHDALRDNYPVVAMLLGADAFRALALQFISGSGASSPILADFGGELADYIGVHPIVEDLPYLADVARLERLATEAHLAADAYPLDAAQLQTLDSERRPGERLALHPSVRFAWLKTPAFTIWDAHRDPEGIGQLRPDWIEEGVLVTRPAGSVVVRRIDHEMYRLLSRIEECFDACAANTHSPAPPMLLFLAECGALVIQSTKEQ